MRQYDRLPQLAVRTIEAARRVDLGEDGLRRFAQQVQYVLAVVEPYRRLLRAEQLGTVAAEFTPEGAQETFRTYAELVRRMEAGNMSDDEFRAFLPETSR